MAPSDDIIQTLTVASTGDGVVIDVLVQPRASKAELTGIHDGALRLRVPSPPVDGAANAAVVKLLADRLGVPRRDVRIIVGLSGRRKRVAVAGLSPEGLRDRLAPHLRPD